MFPTFAYWQVVTDGPLVSGVTAFRWFPLYLFRMGFPTLDIMQNNNDDNMIMITIIISLS